MALQADREYLIQCSVQVLSISLINFIQFAQQVPADFFEIQGFHQGSGDLLHIWDGELDPGES